MSDKTCLDLMVGLGNKYPKQLLNSAVHKGYYVFPKRIVKALEAMKHQKGMKKGFSLGISEVDHKATLWVISISTV
jgi:hypothetical protein